MKVGMSRVLRSMRGAAPHSLSRSAVLCLLITLCFCVDALLSAPSAAARFKAGDDWRHVAQVAGYMSGRSPKRPLVYLLGGSAARECIVSEKSWRAQIVARGGPQTLAFGLGAASQTYDDNIRLLRLLPEAPSIVIIGVNVGRYTGKGAHRLPQVKPRISAYDPHRFRAAHVLSDQWKSAMVTDWLRRRHPVFKARFARNDAKLEELVALCIDRGFHPVLLNLPVNQRVVGRRMDVPRRRYRVACQRICREYGIDWVNWLPSIPLVSADFVDNWHLVEPGRVKWQARLSNLTVRLLKQHGMD